MANIFSPQSTYTYGQATVKPRTAYEIWGSTVGNPYIVQGPTYTPLPPNYQPGQPLPPRQPIVQSSDSGGDSDVMTTPTTSQWQKGNYWANTNWANYPSLIGGLGLAQAGVNPFGKWFGWGNTYMDTYEGPGAEIADSYGIGPGEQRDMLIEQERDMWENAQEEAAFHGTSESAADYGSYDYDADTHSAWTAEEYEDDFGGISFDDDSGGGDSGGGGSYIATATTQALGEEGLKVFEDWRDYMFTALPTFTSSFGRYRVTAPKIVEEIDKKENSKEIYEGIWNKYLKPIFDIIKTDKDSKKALKDYKVMVRELSNKYLKGDK